MAFVEGAGLGGGGFGGQGGDEGQAVGGERIAEQLDKRRVGLRQVPAEILKIHVEALIALFQHRLQHVGRERLLQGRIPQQRGCLRGGEGPGGCERRQVQQRLHAAGSGQCQQPLVVHRHQRAFRRKAVGERGQRPGIRQNAAQHAFGHIRIGIAADDRGAARGLLELGHEDLAGVDPVGAGKVRVHSVQGSHIRPGARGDGRERVAGLHGHSLFRVQDQKTLTDGQPVRLLQAVVPREKAGREPQRPADRKERIAGLYHIDLHTITSQNPMRRAALVFRVFLWYKYCEKMRKNRR